MALPASYLITFRDSDGSRLPLLGAVMAWLNGLPWLEVIIVEQGAAPKLATERLPANVDVLFAYNDGPFNKSWGLNVAARHAANDLLVVADADMITPTEALVQALRTCRADHDAVSPYSNLVDLTAAETKAYLRDGTLPDLSGRGLLHDRRPEGEYICFCGGICVFRRDVYFDLGGMDERFLGWVWEDDAMSLNLERYTDRLAVQDGNVAYHLWHPRPAQRYGHPYYLRNLALTDVYRQLDDNALCAMRMERRSTMGDPYRYRRSS